MILTAPQLAVFHRRTRSILATQKKRAKEDHQALDYDLARLRALVQEADTCPYCGRLLTVDNFSLDHDVPVSRRADYRFANLVVCCRRCNEAKGNMRGDEFEKLMAVVMTFAPIAMVSVLARLRAGAAKAAGRGW